MGHQESCCLRYQKSENIHHDLQQQQVQVVQVLKNGNGVWGFYWKDDHK